MNRISILHEKDNVGTVISKIPAGDTIRYRVNENEIELKVIEDIPLGHKVALIDFAKKDLIIKYGEVIGEASKDIPKGSLVHIHNVESLRGRGDLAKGGDQS